MYGALKRGAAAGTVGGAAYGLFVAAVATPAIAFAETFESGHRHAGEASHAAVDLAAAAPGALGGVLFGLLLGSAFGVAHYVLEPAVPGAADTRTYLLAAAGFVTVSGAPWLALPPQPPGAEYALGSDARIAVYAGMMALGALACALALIVWRRAATRSAPARIAGTAAPFGLLVVAGALAPTAPAGGPVPEAFALAYRGVVVLGQVLLWVGIAGAYAWLHDRRPSREVAPAGETPH